MQKIQGTTFRNETVELDGKEFDSCTFENCQFIYRATDAVRLANCSFVGFIITFEGAAGTTLDFLTKLYHGGFKPTVEKTFDNIRTNNASLTQWTIH